MCLDIRTAIFKLKAEHEHHVQRLTHGLEVANSKLRTYEELEQEIDNAVLRAAKHQRDVDMARSTGNMVGSASHSGRPGAGWGLFEGSTDQLSDAGQALLSSVRNAPSNPERRAKQAVYLAHKLLETEKQRDLLKDQIVGLEHSNKENIREV